MSSYYCQECDRYRDDDEQGANEIDGDIVCDECYETISSKESIE